METQVAKSPAKSARKSKAALAAIAAANAALKAKENAERAAERPAPAKPTATPFVPLTMETAKELLSEARGFIGERQRLALADLIRKVALSEHTLPVKGVSFGPAESIGADGIPVRPAFALSSDKDMRKRQIEDIRNRRRMAEWIRSEVRKLFGELGIETVRKESLLVSDAGAITYSETARQRMSAPKGMRVRL
jgi:hypothetical protein